MFYDDDCYYGIPNGGYDYDAGMSNRAVYAYECGAKPKSKWSKAVIIKKVLVDNENLTESDLSNLTKKQLFDFFLVYDSWHHTSSAYNATDFYKIRGDVSDITRSMLPEREVVKKAKDESPNMYVSAIVSYKISERTKRGWKSVWVDDFVTYRSKDKMVKTSYGNKRVSTLHITKKLEQKTKYATRDRVNKGV